MENAENAFCAGCGSEMAARAITSAAVPENPGETAVTPIAPEQRKMRLLELGLVLGAFAPSIFSSFVAMLSSVRWPWSMPTIDASVYTSLRKLFPIGVMAYVLFRQGRRLSDIGFKWKGNGALAPLRLLIAAWAAEKGMRIILSQVFIYRSHSSYDQSDLHGIAYRLAIIGAVVEFIVNGFNEEFIVRGYLIDLTPEKWT